MSSYDDIIAAGTARWRRNTLIVRPLEHACRLADVSAQALADGIGLNRRQVQWYNFGGGDLEETRRLARLAIEFIRDQWRGFPISDELEAALVALQAAIDEPD